MTNPFSKAKTSEAPREADRLGGGGPQLLESGVYTGKVKALYAGETSNGGHNMTLILTLADGKEYRETFYVMNKDQETFYKSQDGTKNDYQGFTVVNDILLMTTQKGLLQQEFEERTFMIWDSEAKAEKEQVRKAVTACIGEEVSLAIVRELVNRQRKNEQTGKYEGYLGDDGKVATREQNAVQAVFHVPSDLTVYEAENNFEKPVHRSLWTEKFAGKTQDRVKPVDGSSAAGSAPPKPGKPPTAGGQPQRDIFANRK